MLYLIACPGHQKGFMDRGRRDQRREADGQTRGVDYLADSSRGASKPAEDLTRLLQASSSCWTQQCPAGPSALGPYLRLSRVQYRSALDRDQGVRLSGRDWEAVETKLSWEPVEGEKWAPWGAGTKGGYTARASGTVWPECRRGGRCYVAPGSPRLLRPPELYLAPCLHVCASARLSPGMCPLSGYLVLPLIWSCPAGNHAAKTAITGTTLQGPGT